MFGSFGGAVRARSTARHGPYSKETQAITKHKSKNGKQQVNNYNHLLEKTMNILRVLESTVHRAEIHGKGKNLTLIDNLDFLSLQILTSELPRETENTIKSIKT